MSKKTEAKPLDVNLSDVADSFGDDFLIVDCDYKIVLANLATQKRLCKDKDSLVGKHCYQVISNRKEPCNSPIWICPLKKVIQTGSAITITHPQHMPGSDHYIELTAYPLRDKNGAITAIAELRRDVTAQRELESQMLKRHHQLLALSHISSAVRGLWDLNAILRITLDNVLEILNGVTGGILLLDEKTGTLKYRMHRGLSDRYAEKIEVKLGKGIAGKVAKSGEPILLEDISKDPRTAHPSLINVEGLKGFISVPLKAKDKVVGVMNIASHQAGRFGADDVSLLNSIGDYIGTAIEQAKLYQRLEMGKKRYQALLQHTLTAQENERKRIARELHDETSQALTSVTLSLQAVILLSEKLGIKDDNLTKMLKNTHSYAVHTQNEIVKLMKALRPTLLDELGLPAAIHRYAKDALQRNDINVEVEFTGTDKRLPPAIEVTLFRIAQGAIGNILEHSEANNTLVKLECNDSECLLNIEDDGKGFDVRKLTRVDPSGRGAGVFTMKERAKLIYGACRIESQPGHGTKVMVKIPMTPEMTYDEEDTDIDS
jgi:two-component system NarL family sensor kinase